MPSHWPGWAHVGRVRSAGAARGRRAVAATNVPSRTVKAGQTTRELTIVAQDPSVRRGGRILTARVRVPLEELEHVLTMTGTKVEAVERPGRGVSGVVVGEVRRDMLNLTSVAGLRLVDHVDIDTLPQRLFDGVVDDVRHRDRIAESAAIPGTQRQAPGRGAAKSRHTGIGPNQQRSDLAPAQRLERGGDSIHRPARPLPQQHLGHLVALEFAFVGLTGFQYERVDRRGGQVPPVGPNGPHDLARQVRMQEHPERLGLVERVLHALRDGSDVLVIPLGIAKEISHVIPVPIPRQGDRGRGAAVEQIAKSVQGVASNADDLAAAAEETSSAINESAASIEQVTAMNEAEPMFNADVDDVAWSGSPITVTGGGSYNVTYDVRTNHQGVTNLCLVRVTVAPVNTSALGVFSTREVSMATLKRAA